MHDPSVLSVVAGVLLQFAAIWALKQASDAWKRRPRRNNTQEADETARFLRDQRAVTPHNYRNTKETS